jgi:hypothetical protein
VQVPHTQLTINTFVVQLDTGGRIGVTYAPADVRAVVGLAAAVAEQRATGQAALASVDAAIQVDTGALALTVGGGGVNAFFRGRGSETLYSAEVEEDATATAAAATAAHLNSMGRYAAGDDDAVAPIIAEGADRGAPSAAATRAAPEAALLAFGTEDALAAYAPSAGGDGVRYKEVLLQGGDEGGAGPAALPARSIP